MPVLGGEGFLEQIKKSGALRNIPLIFLSSIDDKEQREKLLAMGANDYLLKPYNPAELLARIETIFKSIDSKSISESQKR
jgi:DNA-binding response OmpR family regulator